MFDIQVGASLQSSHHMVLAVAAQLAAGTA